MLTGWGDQTLMVWRIQGLDPRNREKFLFGTSVHMEKGNKEIKMSELAKKKNSNLDQDSPTAFTLFDQNDISVTLELPAALSLTKNERTDYPANLKLTNKTKFTITSATFSMTLDDVVDDTNSRVLLANVSWKGAKVTDPLKNTMNFIWDTPIPPDETADGRPDTPGYSKVQWVATTNNGQGTETFTNNLTLVSLTFGPSGPIVTGPGPTVIVLP
ncbi:hypothetical protein [Pseudomonas chlororaphis]|uniref:hypothetical protein n=1 Tax=Pseudomonas chlororaphis TaxID=587753 RepID=UPI0037CAD846